MTGLRSQVAGLSADKRRLLERMLAGRGIEIERTVILRRDWRDAEAPLSHAQERLWLLDRIEPGTSAYNVPAAFRPPRGEDTFGRIRPSWRDTSS